MDPRSVIIGKRRGGKLEFLSDPNQLPHETSNDFMPFRLTRTHADFEWVALCELKEDRIERFQLPAVTPEATTSRKGKTK